MVTQYDYKGKIFTQVIKKEPLHVTIQTNQQTIRGTIHIRPETRLLDALNEQEHFLAVTDAVIFNSQNEEILRAGFITLNVDHIIWVTPNEEIAR